MRNLEPKIWPSPALLLLLELGAIRGNKWDGGGRLTSRREEEEEEGLNLPAINHRNFVVVVALSAGRGSLLCSLRPKLFPSPSPPQFGVSPYTIFFV